jgi:hypothetical protein
MKVLGDTDKRSTSAFLPDLRNLQTNSDFHYNFEQAAA